ncbi:MAG: hypothetical protein ACFHVJ_14910 [Aestuariibacter sp.]
MLFTIALFLGGLGLAIAILTTLLAFVFKNPEVSNLDIFMMGSKILSQTEKYIKQEWAALIKTLNWLGVSMFFSAAVLIFVETIVNF